MNNVTIGVLPILPTAFGLLGFIVTSGIGALAAIASLRVSACRTALYFLFRQTPSLLVIVAFGGLSYHLLWRTNFTSPVGFVSSTPRSASSWLEFRGSPLRTGHVDQTPGPNQGGIQWSGAPDYEFFSSPAIHGNQIIAVGSKGDTARFFCWDCDTGALRWSYAPPGFRATFSSPVIDQSYLFCGEGLHHTRDARIISFRLPESGELISSSYFQTQSHVECTPVLAGGRIIFGAGDDGVYCLESNTGGTLSQPSVKQLWHVPGAQLPDAETGLAVYAGRVYVGLGFGGEGLSVLDVATGRELQRIALPYPCFSPPAIQGNRIYVGSGRADYGNYRSSTAGEVRCIDLDSFETLWTIPTDAAVLSAIVVHRDTIYFHTVRGELFQVSQRGAIRGRWNAHTNILSAPAVTDQMIYCVSCDGLMTALNHQLKRQWSVRVGTEGDFISSPLVFRGHIYLGTPHDGFVCIGKPHDTNSSEIAPQPQVPNVPMLPRSAKIAWSWPEPPPGETLRVTADFEVSKDCVYLPVLQGERPELQCIEMGPDKGLQIRWKQKFNERIAMRPRVWGSAIVAISGTEGKSGSIRSLDQTSGEILWEQVLSQTPRTFAIDSDSVYGQFSSRHFMRLGSRGEVIWNTEIGLIEQPIAIFQDLLFVTTKVPNRLLAIDKISGQILWSAPIPDTANCSPVIWNQQIILALPNGVATYSMLEGSLIETRDDWKDVKKLWVHENRLVGITAGQKMLISKSGSRSTPFHYNDVNSTLAPIDGLDAIVFVSADGKKLMRLDPASSAEPNLLFDLSHKLPKSSGLSISPVSFQDEILVFVPGTGLICLKEPMAP